MPNQLGLLTFKPAVEAYRHLAVTDGIKMSGNASSSSARVQPDRVQFDLVGERFHLPKR